jgi:DNA-directed RNA polymerase specialized sigma24 family protein
VLHHEQDAEDVFQATFLTLVRKAATIQQGASVGGWLFRVAYRLALRARARGSKRREQSIPPEALLAAAGPDPVPGSPGLPLDEELQRLPEQYRSAVVLCYLEGRTQAEAARMLATTAGTINSRLKRAREILRQRLARHGGLLSGGAIAALLTSRAVGAALPLALVEQTARSALQTLASRGAFPAVATTLARGALQAMLSSRANLLSIVAVLAALVSRASRPAAPSRPSTRPPRACRSASTCRGWRSWRTTWPSSARSLTARATTAGARS